MCPETFQKRTGCSDEVLEKLKIYHALLLKWQRAINLVSPKTLEDAWVRHFYDSAQIEPLIPRGVTRIADLGSGAGFAGLVLAIMRPDLTVCLIESDERKCQFMKNVSRETLLSNTVIYSGRIEVILSDVVVDMVTARALASLEQLCTFMIQGAISQGIFLKGRTYQEELVQAQKIYSFDYQDVQSQTDLQARILHIRNLSRI